MHERYVLMPCRCQSYKEQNLALKEITEIDKADVYISFKIKCLFCHEVKRVKVGILRYYELFMAHDKEV
jgi:hypothetical protein